MIDKLSTFGTSFQLKIISALLSDKLYLQQISDILSPEFFDSEANNWIVTNILEYYNEYKVPPTLDVFKTKALEVSRDVLKMSIVDSLREIMKHVDSEDLQYVKDETLKFCKNQCIKRAILESVEALKQGNYDVIKNKIDAAMRSGEAVSTGYDYISTVHERYQETARNTIPTPWPVVNDLAGGGFAKGELVIVVAGPGAGKCVGPNTLLDIEYEEFGIDIQNAAGTTFTFWINPFESYKLDDVEVPGHKVINFLQQQASEDAPNINMVKTRKIQERIRIKDLFDRLNIENSTTAEHLPDFKITVDTPYGQKMIANLFRTEFQETVTCYFGNNKTLVCAAKHLLKTQRGWLPVVDICTDDVIETKSGSTYLKYIKRHNKHESLYDISVDTVGCYYSNGILSHNSTILMNIGAQAVKKGLTVVHYTLELSEAYISQRYDAVVTGIATQNLKYHVDEIEKELKKLTGKLIVQYFPTKTASGNTLRAHLNKLIISGVKPDMVIVDYADLLRTTGRSTDARHIDLENIYEDLRGMAGEYSIPVFTASQAGRSSSESDVIQGEQVAGAYSKIMIGDFIISLSRKVSDKISGTGRFFIIKNRFGPDGITFPSRISMSNGRMEIFEESSIQGKETKKEMDNASEVIRKTLSQKFKEINKSGLG